MLKDVVLNPFLVQINDIIKNDFGMEKNYVSINNDLNNIYNSLMNNKFDKEFDSYTNSYLELMNNYNIFIDFIDDEYNYKYANGICKSFMNIKDYLYLYIKNKYGLKKDIIR